MASPQAPIPVQAAPRGAALRSVERPTAHGVRIRRDAPTSSAFYPSAERC